MHPTLRLLAVAGAVLALGTGLAVAGAPGGQRMDQDGRFTNLDGSIPQSFGSVVRWGVWDRLTRKRRRSPDRAPVPRVPPDLGLLARPPAKGEGARLTWLGHASWLVQLDGVSLLVDPVLSPSIQGVVTRNAPAALAAADLPPVAAQLVSHNHFDHLDLTTLRRVRAPVVAGLGLRDFFRREGLPATELGWWARTKVGPVTVTFVPAQHWSRRGVFDANKTLWGGFVIEGSSARLYHAGDSAYFPGFGEVGRRFPRLDAILVPIGAYDPAWFMERQHMSPEQAVQATLDCGASAALPMHWGAFKLSDEPLDEPPRRFTAEWRRRRLGAERMRVLAIGESVIVRSR